MSLLKRLFGGGGSSKPAEPEISAEIDYKGFHVAAAPYVQDGQYQVAGTITKTGEAGMKTHRFIRADRCTTREDATEITLAKARQIIDQQGDRMFD